MRPLRPPEQASNPGPHGVADLPAVDAQSLLTVHGGRTPTRENPTSRSIASTAASRPKWLLVRHHGITLVIRDGGNRDVQQIDDRLDDRDIGGHRAPAEDSPDATWIRAPKKRTTSNVEPSVSALISSTGMSRIPTLLPKHLVRKIEIPTSVAPRPAPRPMIDGDHPHGARRSTSNE